MISSVSDSPFTSDSIQCLYRVFVIWNPPLKFGPSSSVPPAATMDPAPSSLPSPSPFPLPPTLPPSCATGEATKAVKEAASKVGSVKQDKERVEPIIKREPQTFAPPIRTSTQQPDRSVANTVQDPVDAVDDEASFSRFLDGCEDRPQSLGGVGSECVGYHRGWKRKKRNLVKLEGNVKATPPVPVRRSLDAIEGKKKILVMPSSSGGRLSSITEMSKLLATIVRLRVRTLAFCGVRKLVELVLKYSLQDLNSSSSSAHLAERVASYRGDLDNMCYLLCCEI